MKHTLALVISILLFYVFKAYSQEKKITAKADFETLSPQADIEKPDSLLHVFLTKTIKYPDVALNNKVGGYVFIQVTVGKDLMISTEVLKGIGLGCEEEVMRVLQKMPKKFLGSYSTKSFIVPVWFNIDDSIPTTISYKEFTNYRIFSTVFVQGYTTHIIRCFPGTVIPAPPVKKLF